MARIRRADQPAPAIDIRVVCAIIPAATFGHPITDECGPRYLFPDRAYLLRRNAVCVRRACRRLGLPGRHGAVRRRPCGHETRGTGAEYPGGHDCHDEILPGARILMAALLAARRQLCAVCVPWWRHHAAEYILQTA